LPTGFIFQQDGASAHTASNAALRTELAAGQLSRYHHNRPLASKFDRSTRLLKISQIRRLEAGVVSWSWR